MKYLKTILLITFLLVTTLFLSVFIRGDKGNPIHYQTEYETTVGGPFESTNSTSRYALVESIVKNNSVFLTEDLARLSAPDLVYYNGRFLSIFTPGVSFIAIPFYYVGSLFEVPQLSTYFSVLLFALINIVLVIKLARAYGASINASIISGIIFGFGTNALAYALTLTQHHMSVTVLLIALLNAFGERTVFKNIVLGAVFGIGLLLDIPNAFLLMPIIVYVLLKHFVITPTDKSVKLTIQLKLITMLIGLLPFIALFGWYNHQTTGSYTLIGQTIGRTNYFDTEAKKQEDLLTIQNRNKTDHISTIPFKTRDQLNGFYTLLISNERAWWYYSPVVFIGFLGLLAMYKKKEMQNYAILAFSVILVNILLYTMFGDPWGGWSFGPRYLIPATAILCATIGFAITKYGKNPFFAGIFLLTLFYSIAINVLGALTTNAIPPRVEAINLPNPIPYTYDYNIQFLEANKTSSLLYNIFFNKYVSVFTFYVITTVALCISLLALYTALFINKNTKGKTK